MHALTMRYAALLATFASAVLALDGIVAPSTVKAGKDFNITFQNANDHNYRVYLAASLSGSNGPTCYLINSTTLNTTTRTLNLRIPAGVGPPATYYSIAISDITTGQGATYSNAMNLTSTNGTYTTYENHLHGSPFWAADHLPCDAYPCARTCAMQDYPHDLEDYTDMKACILRCRGVTPSSSTSTSITSSSTTTAATPSRTSENPSPTESGAAETSSSSAANRQVHAAAAAGFGTLAFLL
ncbi:hypothetical protein AC578_893 [Pseudocercospora eumusae]|uniref:Galactose oxidase-like Early set domain-containing protein n=1 Tax=Pseudocercospora eumusae TaxID=321146 RepID=A0A139GTR2_9PEZI|nr:hypothetical protein AC578_893 [Pseudocercospora eumusae]